MEPTSDQERDNLTLGLALFGVFLALLALTVVIAVVYLAFD